MTREIRGFNNYYWRPYWGQKTHDYEFVHIKLEPDSKNPLVKITIDTVKKSYSWDDPVALFFQLNGKGKGIEKEFRVKSKMEKSLGMIFTELLDANGKSFLFDLIFNDE